MTRIIPTVIIHLTGKEQLIKNREEGKKRGWECVVVCVCVGGWDLSTSLESGPW